MGIAAVEPIINKAGGIISTWDGKSIGSNDLFARLAIVYYIKFVKKIAKIFINTILILWL